MQLDVLAIDTMTSCCSRLVAASSLALDDRFPSPLGLAAASLRGANPSEEVLMLLWASVFLAS